MLGSWGIALGDEFTCSVTSKEEEEGGDTGSLTGASVVEGRSLLGKPLLTELEGFGELLLGNKFSVLG